MRQCSTRTVTRPAPAARWGLYGIHLQVVVDPEPIRILRSSAFLALDLSEQFATADSQRAIAAT